MDVVAGQDVGAAKVVRENGGGRSGAERELYIKKSNSFVACVRLAAKDRGGICLDSFEWSSLTPDWKVIEEQIMRLALPQIDGPPLVPNLLSLGSWVFPCLITPLGVPPSRLILLRTGRSRAPQPTRGL